MRTRIGLCLVLSLLGLVLAARAEAEPADTVTGSQLLQMCGSMVTESGDLRDMEQVAAGTDAMPAGICLGLVTGVLETNRLYEVRLRLLAFRERKKGQEPDPVVTPLFCAPDNYTNGQGVQVFVKYLRAHPEQLNKSDLELLLPAFKEAWPCEAQPKK